MTKIGQILVEVDLETKDERKISLELIVTQKKSRKSVLKRHGISSGSSVCRLSLEYRIDIVSRVNLVEPMHLSNELKISLE